MDFNGKKISVMGLGRSGHALVNILCRLGAEVFVSDARSRSEVCLDGIDAQKVSWEFGRNTEAVFKGKDLVIVSPGVSIDHPVLRGAREHLVPVTGEIELAALLARAPIIAVTGTNGKSTTVSLIHRYFRYHGVSSLLAGNIGTPLSQEVTEHPDAQWIVAEISSFQLETVQRFRPRIGVITNITEDHLDRHGSFENYCRMKARIFENQNETDFAVLNYDDPFCRRLAGDLRAQTWFFSSFGPVPRGVFAEGQRAVFYDGNGCRTLFELKDVPIPGRHNLENMMAAALSVCLAGYSPEELIASSGGFRAPHHRMEYAGRVGDVLFYDDSKGTNPASVAAAVASFSGRNLALIAGGKDKNTDFSGMARMIARHVSALVLIGESSEKIAAHCRNAGFDRIIFCGTDFEGAIRRAAQACAPDGVVLLSPGCTSFDMFACAEHRGDEFKKVVKRLEDEQK